MMDVVDLSMFLIPFRGKRKLSLFTREHMFCIIDVWVGDSMERIIFHVDVNSAYLSWEAIYRLQRGETVDLRTIPSAVGGDPKKRTGIILAKSGPAKKFNIQTGESLGAALKKCPELVMVPPNYSLYMKCSNAMTELLREYSPQIQRFSVDECFMDFTGMEKIYPDPLAVAHEIGNRLKTEYGFTVSIGISSNKLLAKMAGELKKPDGVSTLWPEEIQAKMWPLPVEELFMVGRATAPKLHKMSIYTIGDLAQYDPKFLAYNLKSHGHLIWQYANGLEDSLVKKSNRVMVKGIGNSTTLPKDIHTSEEAYLVLLSLTEMVAMRLRDIGQCARLVAVGIKTGEFDHYGHQHKVLTPTDSTTQIYEYAKTLFDESWRGEPIRHLGVRVSELCDNDFLQLSFFEDQKKAEKQRKLDAAIDEIRLKYDNKAIMRGCFAGSNVKPISGGVGEEDYPLMSSML